MDLWLDPPGTDYRRECLRPRARYGLSRGPRAEAPLRRWSCRSTNPRTRADPRCSAADGPPTRKGGEKTPGKGSVCREKTFALSAWVLRIIQDLCTLRSLHRSFCDSVQ